MGGQYNRSLRFPREAAGIDDSLIDPDNLSDRTGPFDHHANLEVIKNMESLVVVFSTYSEPSAIEATDLAAAILRFRFVVFQKTPSYYEYLTDGLVVGSSKQTVGILEQAARDRIRDINKNLDGNAEITVWEVL